MTKTKIMIDMKSQVNTDKKKQINLLSADD